MVIEMIIRVASADVAEPEAFEATAVPRARCAKALGSTARRRPQVPFPQSARCRLRTPSAIRATAGAASFVGRKGAGSELPVVTTSLARTSWPSPARDVVLAALERKGLFGSMKATPELLASVGIHRR